jgi:iron(III) transport system substrate-binding protein
MKQLVEGAKKEGALTVLGVTSTGKAGAAEIAKAFNDAFGMDIKVEYHVEGQEGQKQAQAMTEHSNGVPPTFDVLEGVTEKVLEFCQAGMCQPVDNWKLLLPDGVTAEGASPGPLEGTGFKFADRTKGIVYNTKLINAAELPKTTKDLADPRFKGKFYTAPWVAAPMFGTLIYSKEEWIKIMSAWGENKAATLEGAQGTKRMMLGEFAFEAFANGYQAPQAQALGDPAGLAFFQDIVPVTSVYHVVTKGTKNPNAATLFALWASGSGFNTPFEKYSGTGNMSLASSAIGQMEKKQIAEIGGKAISWLDTKETLDMLAWYNTPDGLAYQDMILKALKNK